MMVARGKTKIVEEAGHGEVLVRSKDDITAGDGAKHDVLDGKAAASRWTTCNLFQLLERNRVRTHCVDCVHEVTFRARHIEMIPPEVVARRYASGSFRDPFPRRHVPNRKAAEAISPDAMAGQHGRVYVDVRIDSTPVCTSAIV